MNGIDLFVLAVLAISIGIGVFRGVVQEIFHLGGWIIAFTVAQLFAKDAQIYIADWVVDQGIRTVLTWVGLFFGTMMVCSMVASLISGAVKKIGLGPADRLLGGAFGGIRAIAILLIFAFAAGYTKLPQSDVWNRAFTIAPIVVVASYAKEFLPESLARQITFINARVQELPAVEKPPPISAPSK
jgi:membrane protein required for colicin V production